jgi:hypothetical protein
MPGWKKRVYKLDANHKWKSKPGYQIFVADWGAVRFDFPTGWIPVPVEISIRLCDKQPPDNDAALVEALDKQFAADGYSIRALFLRVATMPQTWRVKSAAPGGGQGNVTR